MDFKNKKLGDLVDEMLQMVVKEPAILNPDYKGEKRQLYEAYRDEISKREKESYSWGRLSEEILAN